MGFPPDAYIHGMPDVGDFTTLGAGPGAMVGGMPNMGITPPPQNDHHQQFVNDNRRHVAPRYPN